MPRADYGPSVIAGEVQYFSSTSLSLADPDSSEGCLRKYWYEKVAGRKPPTTRAQSEGVAVHAEIESYLRTGTNTLGPLASRGKRFIPVPGPDLLIEHDIVIPPHAQATSARLSDAPLRLRGIPVVGYIDLVHARTTTLGESASGEFEYVQDPDDTVEVVDWKTTSRPEYIKSAEGMSKSTQMTVYGKWVTTTLPGTKHVRLSHVYFITKGQSAPRKVSLRLVPEQIDVHWRRLDRVAGSIVDVAREHDPERVPANTRACGAFGGCAHRPYCTAVSQDALVSFFGAVGADNMIRRLNNMATPQIETRTGSLLGISAKKRPAPTEIREEFRDELLRVAREEIENRYPGLPSVWDELQSYKLGNPAYTGELARIVGELAEGAVNRKEIPGSGELAVYGPFNDPAQLPQILSEAKAFMTTNMPACEPSVAVVPAPAEPEIFLNLLPPEAPQSVPAQAPSELPAPKKVRGRPRKAESPVGTDTQLNLDLATPSPLYFYVDCAPSCPHQSFWPFVDEIVADLNAASDGAVDFRLVSNDHKFAYGRWKAAIAAALRAAFIPGGHYVLAGGNGEIATAVAEAMRILVHSRGGVFVQ